MKKLIFSIIFFMGFAHAEQRQNVLPPPGTQAVPAQFMLYCSRDSAGMFHFLEHQYGEIIRAILTKTSSGVDIYLTVDSGEDGTFSLIGVKDNTACLIFSGGPVLWSDDRPANRSDRHEDVLGDEL